MPERVPYRPTPEEEKKANEKLTFKERESSNRREKYVKAKKEVELLAEKIAEKKEGAQSARNLYNFLVEHHKEGIGMANYIIAQRGTFAGTYAQEYNLSDAKDRALYCLTFGYGRKSHDDPRMPIALLATLEDSDVPEPEKFAILSLAYRKDSEGAKESAHLRFNSAFVKNAFLDYAGQAAIKSEVFSGERSWKEQPDDIEAVWGEHTTLEKKVGKDPAVIVPDYEPEEDYEVHEEKIPGHNDIYDGRTRDIDPNIR